MRQNPVFHKEMLTRYRLRQPTPARLGLALGAAALVGWLYWLGMSALLDDADPSMGASIWGMAICAQFLLVCVAAPAVTANAFTQEKEQQTWQMLLFTRLEPGEIIFGKLLARLLSLVAILLLFLPFTIFSRAHAAIGEPGSSSYVSPGQMLVAYIVIVITGFTFATLGLFLSWRFQRTLYALVTAYTLIFGVLCLGTALIAGALTAGSGGAFTHHALLWINPLRLIAVPLTPNDTENSKALSFGLCLYAAAAVAMLGVMLLGWRRVERE